MIIKEEIKLIEKDGWVLVKTRGSHRQYKHQIKSGLVTIPEHLNEDIAIGTFKSILKQSGINNV